MLRPEGAEWLDGEGNGSLKLQNHANEGSGLGITQKHHKTSNARIHMRALPK